MLALRFLPTNSPQKMTCPRLAPILVVASLLPALGRAQVCGQRVSAPPAQPATAAFGGSFALSPEHAFIGDPLAQGTGLLHHYRRHPWSRYLEYASTLLPSSIVAGDEFGASLDLDGLDLVVGAPAQDALGTEGGAAYAYRWTGTQWVDTTRFGDPNGSAGDRFGEHVALEGEWLAIGNPSRETIRFYRDVQHTWIFHQELGFPGAGGVADFSAGRLLAYGERAGAVVEFDTATQTWARTFSFATGSAFELTGADLAGDTLVVGKSYGTIEEYRHDAATGNWSPAGIFSVPATDGIALVGDRVLASHPTLQEVRSYVRSGTQRVPDKAASPAGFSREGFATDGASAMVFGVSEPSLVDFDCGAVGVPGCYQSTSLSSNSTGSVGSLQALGSDVLADYQIELFAFVLPDDAFGYFLASRIEGFYVSPGNAQGALCLENPIGRFVGPGQIQNTGPAGSFRLFLDLTALPTPTGPVSASVGETWYFQAWHRDANPQPTSNFTDSVGVMLR